MGGLLAVDRAIEQILSECECSQKTEQLPIADVCGRVLAESVVSSIDVPPLDNSAMDGYALRYADLDGRPLAVSQRIAAGQVGGRIKPGTAARIFTGAPIPLGADTIVMQEDVDLCDGVITITEPSIKLGQHVRPKGQDIAKGREVLLVGRRLKPQDIGVLASIGVTDVVVYRPLKVAVISTGNELVEPGQPLAEGQIYNSNRFMLSALLQSLGCEVIDGGVIVDDFASTAEQLSLLAAKADVLISSGGVSVGEEDHVKTVVEALGELNLWRLNMKPGKPVAFGRIVQTPFFGLPGNPASSFVSFCLLVRPYLFKAMGRGAVAPLMISAKADFDTVSSSTRQEYSRARVSYRKAQAWVERYHNQSSGVLLSTSWANALAVIEPGTTVNQGDVIGVLLLSELLH